jgi:hypothetical protein
MIDVLRMSFPWHLSLTLGFGDAARWLLQANLLLFQAMRRLTADMGHRLGIAL